MKNIDKEPTYYVSLTEYNEVKRMFLKANDEISKLKELLKEVKDYLPEFETLMNILAKIDEVLGEK